MAELPSWWNRVDEIFRKAGVPTQIWTSIAYAESSFVPTARNTADPNGGSYGLFALNLGGQGRGYQVPYLLDPINNAMIAVKYIGPAVKRCGADNIACVSAYSGHPVEDGSLGMGNALIRRIAGLFNHAKTLASGQEIYDSFTSGHGADPGEGGGSGENKSAWQRFWEGFWGGFGTGLQQPITGGGTDAVANISMGVTGIGLIITGVIISAAKSPVGKAAISAASPAAGAAFGAAAASRGIPRSAPTPPPSATVRTVPSRVASVRAAPTRRALK